MGWGRGEDRRANYPNTAWPQQGKDAVPDILFIVM